MIASDGRDVPPWKLWAAPIGIVLGFVLAEILTAIVYGIGAAGGHSSKHPTPAMQIVGSVVFDVGFIAAALVVTIVAGGGRGDFGFRRVGWRAGIASVVVGAVAYYVITAVYQAVLSLHQRDNLPSDFGLHRSHWAIAGTAAFVCVIAPICEETFFRGFLFGVLRQLRVPVAGRQLGPWLAAVIVGVLFGLAHTGSANAEYLVPLGFLGFVLCLMRWRTGSLYPGMALHSANNAVALGVQLHWSVAVVVALLIGSWLVVAAIAWPLGARNPALA